MQEIFYVLFFLTVWFIVPFFAGRWLFGKLKKKFCGLGNEKGAGRIFGYVAFLLCALLSWFVEVLVLTGIKMIL
ncbi:MAG TPA: hypothetical protein VFU15_00115 [Bacteroidia bacterium]|nr:hypothetical protein [Bacteroidia bacterium]